MQFSSTNPKSYLWLDPRTKFIMLFFVGIYVFSAPPPILEASIMGVLALLLLAGGQQRAAIRLAFVYAVLLLLDLLAAPLLGGAFHALYYTVVRLTRLLLPIIAAALLLIRTTTVNEFIAAFRKMHLPDAFIIPVSVMFRFIPTVSEEWRSIRNAMCFRGIGISAKAVLRNPLRTLEYTFVPLLMSTATIANDLAAASLAHGLESGVKRSCIRQVNMGLLDVLLLLYCSTLVAIRGRI